MDIREHVLLRDFSTMRVGGKARYFVRVQSSNDLEEVRSFVSGKKIPILVLGAGSNVVINDEGFPGLVLKIEIQGTEYKTSDEDVFVTVGSGVLWDDLVREVVSKKLYGLENLSLIPGTVGAAPVQNIGAYGVEVKETIVSVTAFDLENGMFKTFSNAECLFGYRDSIFKKPEYKKYCITSVVFKLSKKEKRCISYKDLAVYFENKEHPSLQEIRDAVVAIRTKKMPDLRVFGTVGSFWKNPVVTLRKATELSIRFQDLPIYETHDDLRKISLAWILDKVLNLKGYSMGKVSLFKHQPLVIVVTEGASFEDIREFAKYIEKRVFDEIGVSIEREAEYIEGNK